MVFQAATFHYGREAVRYWATPAYRRGDASYDNVVILRQNEDLLTAPAARTTLLIRALNGCTRYDAH